MKIIEQSFKFIHIPDGVESLKRIPVVFSDFEVD